MGNANTRVEFDFVPLTRSSSKARPKATPGKLRIIGGSLRGSRLAVPDMAGLRPTPDRVRETLFNWLTPMLPGARCLDLFAGTGALGIEALSRGAGQVDFVERNASLTQALRDNLARLKQTATSVRNTDAIGLLAQQPPARPYDLVFIDPPFDMNLWDEAAARLNCPGWLADAALMYVESPLELALGLPDAWQIHREDRAGAVRYALYRRSAKLRDVDGAI